MYKKGDIVKVKNAKNGLGVYMIAEDHAQDLENNYPFEYKVWALDIDRETLPYDKSGVWRVRPQQYLTMAAKNPELYSMARFRKYNRTTKMSYNIVRKLPFNSEQVIA